MKIIINIETNNAAFQEYDKDIEIDKILDAITSKIFDGKKDGTCYDSNGNNVGNWTITGE